MPEVSIILPVYNEERHLFQTLSAICAQTFRDFELIATDDGSTDRSRSILEAFAASDPRISVLAQRHGGVSRARNRALEAAKGKWVWFVDSDDLPFADFLEKALGMPEADRADILMGSYVKININGTFARVSPPKYGLVTPESLPVYFMQTQYETGVFGYLWNKLLRREKLISTGAAFEETMTLAEDLQFLIKLYRAGASVLFVPHCAMQYTEHPLRREADHLAQLKLQSEIRQWIVAGQKHTEYEHFFQKKCSAYAVYAVFYAPDIQKDPIERAEAIMADTILCAQLSEAGLYGVFRWIVYALRHKNSWLLRGILSAYSAARWLRSALKGGVRRAIRFV